MSQAKGLQGIRCGILTASDRVSKGQGKNESGAYLAQTLAAEGAEVLAHVVVPDDIDTIARTLADMADSGGFDVVVVGHRGRGAVRRALLGSVADRLVQISNRPVLVVR